jgi:hydrogenase maturation protein HypF
MNSDGCRMRRRLVITGVVQGVGFRPFVWRLATRAGLSGFVENTPVGVVVEIQGPAEAVAEFERDLTAHPPPLARIDEVVAERCEPRPADPPPSFLILETVGGDGPRTDVPPDVATCDACLAELNDPTDRRHGHPFISCTDCGPRFTIIERLPYDRPATTMASFQLCPQCAAEYADPADRRFHAQPICCPDCGPVVWFARTADGVPVDRPPDPGSTAAAVMAGRDLLTAGGILAVKNLGGFHLACDATNPTAVALLRERKHRPSKPLAVMVADLRAVRGLATVDEQAARLLGGPERPILLLPKRSDSPLAAAVAPGNDFVGLMLPAAPLQHLLAGGMPPLVMTSGNLAEEPIARGNAEAVQRLAGIADGFLLHDRPIHVPCDDSVVRCVGGMPLPIRRSRGHVPLPVPLATGGPCVLAVGGELKATLCLAIGDRAIMSQHVGDVGNLETLAVVEQAAEHLLRLFAATPVAIAADLHPGYLSADWASRCARARGLPLIRIQHHEAHAAALLTEHFGSPHPALTAGPCLIACFDGTGYGPPVAVGEPGIIRGGEFFLADDVGLRHVASLAPFPLPGGDAAIRHPWRIALALLHAAGIAWDNRLPAVAAATAAERRLLRQQLDRGLACLATTSMGRLFDGVAALVGGPPTVTFEAEAALTLESRAAHWAEPDETRFNFTIGSASSSPSLVIDWRPLVAAIVADVIAGQPAAGIAAGFHRAVVRMIEKVRCTLGPEPPTTVGLTGGVFQNATLVEQATAGFRSTGCSLLLHHAVPPSDGGLALGQALLARKRLSNGSG